MSERVGGGHQMAAPVRGLRRNGPVHHPDLRHLLHVASSAAAQGGQEGEQLCHDAEAGVKEGTECRTFAIRRHFTTNQSKYQFGCHLQEPISRQPTNGSEARYC